MKLNPVNGSLPDELNDRALSPSSTSSLTINPLSVHRVREFSDYFVQPYDYRYHFVCPSKLNGKLFMIYNFVKTILDKFIIESSTIV